MKYRLLAVLMVAFFAFNLMPSGIAHATVDDSADSTVVKFLGIMGIMGIDEKTGYFWDETPVRRAEMAEILCKLFGLEAYQDTAIRFNDVKEAERAYVETVVRNGYMSGYSSTTFGPDDYITNGQLLKIFVCVIGGERIAEQEGGYLTGYVETAKRLGLIRNINGSIDADARRIDVAGMIYAAMNADMVQIDSITKDANGNISDISYSPKEGETFLTERLHIYRMKGIVRKIDSTSLTRGDDGAGTGYAEIGNTLYDDPNGLADEYLGCEVNYFLKMTDGSDNGEIIFIEETSGNRTLTIENAEIDIGSVSGTTVKYYLNEKSRTLNVSSVADMIYNGKAITRDFSVLENIKDGRVKLIDCDGDQKYETIIVTEYQTGVVNSVNQDLERLYLQFDASPVDLHDSICKVFRNGEKAELRDLSQGDVVLVAVSSNTAGERAIRIEATSESKDGILQSEKKDARVRTVKIGDEEYTVNPYCDTLSAQGKIGNLEVGASGQFYLDAKGRIVYFGKGTDKDKVAFLLAIEAEKENLMPRFAVKLYTQNGQFEVLEAGEKLKINGKSRKVSEIVNDRALIAELRQNVVRQHLVLYRETEGVLTEFTYTTDNGVYDAQEFSCDESAAFTCYRTAVLQDKYYADSKTVVFRTPPLGVEEDDPAMYAIQNGSAFVSVRKYTLKLYDIQGDGYIKYALRPMESPFTTTDSSPMMVITAVNDGIDEEGEPIKLVEGFDNNGAKVEVKTSPEYADIGSLSRGDVIQYATDAFGDIRTILYLHDVAGTDYYNIMANNAIRQDSRLGTGYGNVISVNPTTICIKCGEIYEGMTPNETDKIVSTNCGAVYAFYGEERDKVEKIGVGDIVRGDKIFACNYYDNKTRMIVVYR